MMKIVSLPFLGQWFTGETIEEHGKFYSQCDACPAWSFPYEVKLKNACGTSAPATLYQTFPIPPPPGCLPRVKNPNDKDIPPIYSIEVFDILGRLLYKGANFSTFFTPKNQDVLTSQVLLIRNYDSNGKFINAEKILLTP